MPCYHSFIIFTQKRSKTNWSIISNQTVEFLKQELKQSGIKYLLVD
uniref:Uncharacterized protein n=1 Tax=Rhizophora mucronata TaxID=61149 RepID=A0A2P2NID9_RHIMU